MSAHSGAGTLLGVESDMASAYVGVCLLGDGVKWSVLIHSREQSTLQEPWEEGRR